MDFVTLLIISLAAGSINTFDNSFIDPSISEQQMFNELLEKFLIIDIEKKDISEILRTFEKPYVKTFPCDKSDRNELVVNVVETRVAGFSVPQEMEQNVILGGTYTWQCKITTGEEGVITVDCDNSIKLNPDVVNQGRKDSRVHQVENAVLLYHELLHGQLMLEAITSSEKWRNDVCNKKPSDQIDLSYSDKEHKVISPLQNEFTEKLVEQKGGLFLLEEINPEQTNNGNFSKTVLDFHEKPQFADGILISYRVFNVEQPKVSFPESNVVFSGKLRDETKPGKAWLFLFDDKPIPDNLPIESIPQWIKKNASWWAQGTITDTDFLKGIEYLVLNDIIEIENIETKNSYSKEIPSWIRNNASWWSANLISDTEFINGIKYLIEVGIISYQ